MSGVPYWLGSAVGKEILINGRRTILRDGYCVSDRDGVPNSDELILVTDAGAFNTRECNWEFTKKTRRELGWRT